MSRWSPRGRLDRLGTAGAADGRGGAADPGDPRGGDSPGGDDGRRRHHARPLRGRHRLPPHAGLCSGCPSSTATLKMGIETRLREVIPEAGRGRPVAALSSGGGPATGARRQVKRAQVRHELLPEQSPGAPARAAPAHPRRPPQRRRAAQAQAGEPPGRAARAGARGRASRASASRVVVDVGSGQRVPRLRALRAVLQGRRARASWSASRRGPS